MSKQREELEGKVKELKEMIAKDDFDKEAVKKKIEEINPLVQEIGKKMYEEAAKADEGKKEEGKDKKEEPKAQDGEVVE